MSNEATKLIKGQNLTFEERKSLFLQPYRSGFFLSGPLLSLKGLGQLVLTLFLIM